MNASFHVHWPPLALALVVALVAVWLNQEARRPLPVDDPSFDLSPDFTIRKFDSIVFDGAGKPKQSLVSPHVSHIPADDATRLESPVLRTFDPTHPMRITSNMALIRGSGEVVHFVGQVHAVRHYPDDSPVTVDTEYLVVHPDANLMSTNRFATLRQGKSVTDGRGGLTMDQDTKQLSLVGGVRGIYETKH